MQELLATIIVMAIVMFIAFLIETLVEYLIAPWFDKVKALTPYKWAQMYVAAAVGVLAAFLYQLDLVHLLSLFLSQISGTVQIIAITPFGLIVTGLAMGRGSNFIHDVFGRFFTKQVLDDLNKPASQA